MKRTNVKRPFIGFACTAALVTSLAACGGTAGKAALPSYTGTPSTTSTATASATTTPKASTTKPIALAAHSTYQYGGLTLIVNLPADIPKSSQNNMRFFVEFLQADARTVARAKVDPAILRMASANVVKDERDSVVAASVQGIGTQVYTVTKVSSGPGLLTFVDGCLDQSKVVEVRKDGTHFVDAEATNDPTLKVRAEIKNSVTGRKVTSLTFDSGTC